MSSVLQMLSASAWSVKDYARWFSWISQSWCDWLMGRLFHATNPTLKLLEWRVTGSRAPLQPPFKVCSLEDQITVLLHWPLFRFRGLQPQEHLQFDKSLVGGPLETWLHVTSERGEHGCSCFDGLNNFVFYFCHEDIVSLLASRIDLTVIQEPLNQLLAIHHLTTNHHLPDSYITLLGIRHGNRWVGLAIHVGVAVEMGRTLIETQLGRGLRTLCGSLSGFQAYFVSGHRTSYSSSNWPIGME